MKPEQKNEPEESIVLEEKSFSMDEIFLKGKTIDEEKNKIRKRLGMKTVKRKKEKTNVYDNLMMKLYKAGLKNTDPEKMIKKTTRTSAIVVFVTAMLFLIDGIMKGQAVWWIIIKTLFILLIGFGSLHALIMIAIKVYLNYKGYKRANQIEQVLPDFLRLVASNHRSGSILEEALNQSIKKRYGVLSEEMSLVIKISKVNGELGKALLILGKKYPSKILERAMTNISLAIKSGANISTLLERIANNITKMRIIQANMAASVKNYLIFIIVAAIVVTPLMFAISYHMNETVGEIKEKIASTSDSSGSLVRIDADSGVSQKGFNAFVILMLITTSTVSTLLISAIRYGDFRQGIKKIPVFMITSLLIYFIGRAGIIKIF